MQDQTDLDATLISDYLLGDASPADRAVVERWVGEDPHRRRWLQQIEEALQLTEIQPTPALDTERFLGALASRTGVAALQPGSEANASPTSRLVVDTRAPRPKGDAARRNLSRGGSTSWVGQHAFRHAFLGVSAAIVLAVGAWLSRGHGTSEPIRQYETAPGQRSTVQLADGSTMILAPATSVAITPNAVEVRGEAYFAITPHSVRPFVVRTQNAIVRVLGTKFSVRQYPSESASRVVVDDGKVTLRSLSRSLVDNAQTVLTARMLAQVTDSGVTVSTGISSVSYTGWTRGLLVFDGATLRDVVTELNRAYGVDIHVADTTLATQEVIMEVSVTQQPISRILDLIGKVTGSHYTRDGQRYVIVPGRVATQSQPPAPQHHYPPQPEKLYGR